MPTNPYNANNKGGKDFLLTKKSSERTLILAGGGTATKPWANELYSTFVKLSGERDAKIGIITAASKPRQAEKNGHFYENIFSELGAHAEWIPIDIRSRKNSYNKDLVKKIESMTGIFYGAGNQTRYTTSLRNNANINSPMLNAMNLAYKSGATIAGTSAGTAIQCSSPMIRGDNIFDPYGGFGFFPYGILDTHFSQRNRESRLINLARKTKTSQAYGIDEDTILIVKNVDTPQTHMEVLGEHGVHIYTNISKKGFKMTRLKAGDTYYPPKP